MRIGISNLLLLSAIHILYTNTVTGASLGTSLRQRLSKIAEFKRSISGDTDPLNMVANTNHIYSRTASQVGEAVYRRLYREIIHGNRSVDILLLLDGSSSMGLSGFNTAQRFMARLISMMPRTKFLNGSIKVAMLTYSLSQDITQIFSFRWEKGMYREMVRRAIKKAQYQGGHENHGSSAMVWAENAFHTSPRYNSTNTNKVILYGTNGHITDRDLLYGYTDASYQIAHELKNQGYKLFTIVPGTDVDRPTIGAISSEPNVDYIIPVVNTQYSESISNNIKDHIRGAHQHNAS